MQSHSKQIQKSERINVRSLFIIQSFFNTVEIFFIEKFG